MDPNSSHNTDCVVSHKKNKIDNFGKTQLESHSKSKDHIKNTKSNKQFSIIESLNKNIILELLEKVLIAEYVLCYYSMKHHRTIYSMNCSSKIYKEIFDESKISTGINFKKNKYSIIS